MDTALPAEEVEQIEAVLNGFKASHGVDYHALRTRQSGANRFAAFEAQKARSLFEAEGIRVEWNPHRLEIQR